MSDLEALRTVLRDELAPIRAHRLPKVPEKMWNLFSRQAPSA
jgi:hypothetical protein